MLTSPLEGSGGRESADFSICPFPWHKCPLTPVVTGYKWPRKLVKFLSIWSLALVQPLRLTTGAQRTGGLLPECPCELGI